MKRWLMARGENPHTRRNYAREGRRLLDWLQNQGLSLQVALDAHMALYKRHLLQELRLGSSSIRFSLTVANGLFAYAADLGHVARNPMLDVRLPKKPQRQVGTFLTQEECQYVYSLLEAWLSAAAGHDFHRLRQRWVFCLAYYTGMRREEMAKAGMSDMFRRRGREGDAWWLSVDGKGGQQREVPVSSSLMWELGRYRMVYGLPAEPQRGEDFGLIFRLSGPDRRYSARERLSASSVYEIIKSLLVDVARECDDNDLAQRLAAAATHWLRHSHATGLMDNVGDLRIAQEQLGHMDLATTSIYSHVRADARRAAVETLRLHSPIGA